jgi:hypothetical protein
MKFNKIKYLKMVNFLRANTGRIFALYDPPHGQRVKALGFVSQTLIKVPGLKNKDELVFHLKHYIINYNLYPDEPIVTFSEDYTKIKIQESFYYLTKKCS